jgi:putative nucleotidyltransferase with HDIG domain
MRYIKDEEPARIFFLLLLLFYLYNFVLQPLGFLRVPALRSNDFFVNLSLSKKKPPPEIKDILIVAVDNYSLKEAGLQWPWKRSTFAELINRISAGGPKAIFLDFTFLGKSQDAAWDIQLAEAVKNAGNVILAAYIDEDGEYVQPLDIFVSSARAVGLVNKRPEDSQDLRVRKMRAVFPGAKGRLDFGAEIKILALARGIPFKEIQYDKDSHKVILSPRLSFSVDGLGFIPINYALRALDFKSIPAYKILSSQADEPSIFKDKLVMVGMTANITHDVHPTPLGMMPGVYINSYSLAMLLAGNLPKVLPYWWNIGVFLIFFFTVGFTTFCLKPRYSLLILSTLLTAIAACYFFLRARYNFVMDIFSLIFLSIVSYAAVEMYKYIRLLIASEKLKLYAIMDSLTMLYTQRYFQLYAQSLLQKQARAGGHFFCLVSINEFPRLSEKQALILPHLIKMLSKIIKECLGGKSLLARYGENALSVCIEHIKRKQIEKSLALLVEEIANREFVIGEQIIKISVKIAGVDFPRERIKNYADLVLTCEAMLKRIAAPASAALAVFDPKIDRIIAASEDAGLGQAMPKGELGYVTMDLAARNKELESALEELKTKQKEIARTYFYAMHSLVKALEEKDLYTAGHSERVSFYATALAEGLRLPKEEIEAVNRAAYLHDIGKIGLPDRILHKKERLSDEEFEFVKRHQAQGAKILEGLPFFEEVIPLVLYHHERYDGKGYPHGLTGDMIPRGAQLIAIADSFDAMTTGRGYNSPLLLGEAVGELRKCSGQQFNPAYVNTFVELAQQKKILPV